MHNNIPNPATLPHEDNNSMWVPDFSPAHYDKMLYSKTGITERVRTDLTGPDGQQGIDISGHTMNNMYEEMSKGAYTVDGQASPWITVPHSEALVRRLALLPGRTALGRRPEQAMNGHPDNPHGAGQLATDAVDALAAADPNFPWADYDIEDQGDRRRRRQRLRAGRRDRPPRAGARRPGQVRRRRRPGHVRHLGALLARSPAATPSPART